MEHASQRRKLLHAAEEAGFDVLLTTDKNLPYQQNLRDRKISVVALGKSRWSLIRPLLDRIAAAITNTKPGTFTLVEVPNDK